jgi:hypothetical protein
MKPVISLLPLLPLFIPLIGAPVAWMMPQTHRADQIRRWWHASVLFLTCLLLLIGPLYNGKVAELPFQTLLGSGESLSFSLDSVGRTFALLLTGALAAVSISSLARPIERFEAVLSLIIAGASVGVSAANNLLTLCLSWGLMDIALLGLGLVHVPEESIPHALRNGAINLTSVVILVAATVLPTLQPTEAHWWTNLSGLPLQLLMVVALLRLGVYPLPGSVNRRWEGFAVSVCAGGYIWLRIAGGHEGVLPGTEWLSVIMWIVLLITGILTALSTDFATALPYVVLNHMAILVLAPLLDAQTALGVIVATALNLALCLALLRVDLRVRPLPPLDRWVRLPLVLALASLAGWPFTLGFYSRWTLLAAGWQQGWHKGVLVGAIAFALASIPLWQRYFQLQREVREDRFPRWAVKAAVAVAFLLAFLLVLSGVAISVLRVVPLGLTQEFPTSSLAGLWPGSFRVFAALFLTAFVVPFFGGYALHRLRRRIPGGANVWLDTPSAVLELNWLYVSIELILVRGRHLVEQVLLAVEESFYLGWILLWGLVLLFYFAGR